MSQEVNFHWIASVRPQGKEILQVQARDTIRRFFKHFTTMIGRVHLKVYRIKSGVNPDLLITIVPHHPDIGPETEGVRVNIWTQGTQGLLCLMRVDDVDQSYLREIVNKGPYNRKCRDTPETDVDETTPIKQNETIVRSVASMDSIHDGVPQVNTTHKPLTIAQFETKLSKDDLEGFKTTLSSIIYRAMCAIGESKVPNTLRISRNMISRAYAEQLRLEGDLRSDLSGLIANFYRHRFSLFAVKCDDPGMPVWQQQDWLVDGNMVRDFVGGEAALLQLAKTREAGVVKTKTDTDPPDISKDAPTQETASAPAIETPQCGSSDSVALTTGSIADVIQKFAVRKVLIQRREQAQAEELHCREIVSTLELQLVEARSQLANAIESTRVAELQISNQQVSAEDINRIREAQHYLNELMKGT